MARAIRESPQRAEALPGSAWAATAASPPELAQAVAAYTLLLIFKLAVFLYTGMLVVLALALHSLGGVIVSAFLLYASRAWRQADPAADALTVGRARSAATLVGATVSMSFISFRLCEEAIGALLNPHQALYSSPELAFALVLGSMLAGSVPIVRTLSAKPARRLTWSALPSEAHLMEALNDELALLVGLAGVVLLNHGVKPADAWAALVIALLIAVNAVGLVRTHWHLLLGGPAPSRVQDRIAALAQSVPGVREVRLAVAEGHRQTLLRTRLYVGVAPGTPIEQATGIAAEVQRRLEAEFPSSLVVVLLAAACAGAERSALDEAQDGMSVPRALADETQIDPVRRA